MTEERSNPLLDRLLAYLERVLTRLEQRLQPHFDRWSETLEEWRRQRGGRTTA